MEVQRPSSVAFPGAVLGRVTRIQPHRHGVHPASVGGPDAQPARNASHELDRVTLRRGFVFDAAEMKRLVREHLDGSGLDAHVRSTVAVDASKRPADFVTDAGVVRGRVTLELHHSTKLEPVAYFGEVGATHGHL